MNAVGVAIALVAALHVSGVQSGVSRVTDFSVTHCMNAIETSTAADPQRCPPFLREAVAQACSTCLEVGGVPVAIDAADIWSLDIDADGAAEFIVDTGQLVICNGAFSVFSCGSLGCPKALYQHRDGAWRNAGGLYADEPASVELLSRGRYADLKVSCSEASECVEYWYYQWRGEPPLDGYERTFFTVRGRAVAFEDSIHGLYGLIADTDLLATPDPGATRLARYAAATEVAIVGTSADGAYFYVSPCNACSRGFVPRSAVASP